jgi:hypothetical protein
MQNNVCMVQLIERYPVIVSLVATLVVVAVTVWATRRWGGNRRTRLRMAWDSVGMVAARTEKKVEIRLDGIVVDDPYLVTVTFHNAGPGDISESSFSRSMPLKVNVVGARVVDVVDTSDDAMPQQLSDDHILLVGPGHLPAKSRRTLLLFTEGKPEGLQIGHLVNVDIKQVSIQNMNEGMARQVMGGPFLGTLAGAAAGATAALFGVVVSTW